MSHMKSTLPGSILVLLVSLVIGVHVCEASDKDGPQLIVISDHPVSDAWLAKARAEYPRELSNLCFISNDKLEVSDMGPLVDYVYQQAGKPDRLIRMCCKHCVKDFKKDPDKYLGILDRAEAKSKPSLATSEGH
jgi:hypothetical protein